MIESTRTWKGIPVYDCPDSNCRFDSLEREVTEDHFRKTHMAPPAPSSLINPATNRRFDPAPEEARPKTRSSSATRRRSRRDNNGSTN